MKLSIAAVTALLFAISEAAADASSKTPLYKNPKAKVDDRVADLLKRMTIEDKTSQLVQGDIRNWLDTETGAFNKTGLEWSMATRSGSFYVGVPVDQQWIAENIKIAQDYLVHNTTLGIPSFTQTEGIHGFLIEGLNTGPVHGGERELRTTYLPPFKRQIIDADVYSIMTSYNSYDGVAMVANYHVLTEILRNEWGYKYFTMSDAGGTDRLCAQFKMCESNPVDMEAIVNYVSYLCIVKVLF